MLTEQASFARTAVHRLALEVGCERALAIGSVLESLVPVCTEGTREHTDVSKYTLKRLVQNVGHLVLFQVRR